MRFIHVHIFFDSYFYSASGFMTLWACICIALVFPQQADSSPAFEDGDLFLTEPQPDINNNFFLDDGSGSSDFSSLSIEPQPVLDDVALTSALTDQVSLADTSDDECSMNYVLPSSSSKSRLRARLTTDSCNNPDVTIEGVEGGKNPTMTAEEIKKRWCGGTNVPILEFGNVPVCQERGQGVFSEYLLPETELSSGYFQTLFRGTMSKNFDFLIWISDVEPRDFGPHFFFFETKENKFLNKIVANIPSISNASSSRCLST